MRINVMELGKFTAVTWFPAGCKPGDSSTTLHGASERNER